MTKILERPSSSNFLFLFYALISARMLLAPCNLFAEEVVRGSERRTYDGIKIVERTVFEDSSRVLREGKRYSLLFGASLTGRKAQVEYFINPNNLVFYSPEYQRTPNHIVAHSAGMKTFLGDTFFLSGGVFYKISDFANTRQRSSGLTASFGNLWIFGHVQIGGEWLQVFQSIVVHEGDPVLKLLPHSFRFLIGAVF